MSLIAHPTDGTLPSDTPPFVRRPQLLKSRVPRPRGQVFVDPPELGLSDDTEAEEQVPDAPLRRAVFSTNAVETRDAVPVQNRQGSSDGHASPQAPPTLATSISIAAIDRQPRESYGPVQRNSPTADRLLVGPNEGDQISSLPPTPTGSARSPGIRRKPLPKAARPIKMLDYWKDAPRLGGTIQQYADVERLANPASVDKAPGLRRPRRLVKGKSMFNLGTLFRGSRPESGVAGVRIASQGSSIPKPAKSSISDPAPARLVAPQPVQPAMPKLAMSAISVQAETLPSPPVCAPTVNQPPANASVSPTTIALPQGGQGNSTPQSWARLTQCVNRLGKRLVEENDPDQRKKLYAVS